MARWWILVVAAALAGCGGGDPEPDEPDTRPPVNCQQIPRPVACL